MSSASPVSPTSSTAELLPRLRRQRPLAALCLACFLCTLWSCSRGPSREEIAVYLADKPRALHPLYEAAARAGERDVVLAQMEAGLAAANLGFHDLAEGSFDVVLSHVETIFGSDADAAKARSMWHKEGRKRFRGEPYERAMAYLYRGLLYLRAGDYQNARACFINGGLQDAFAEEEQDRCDFAAMWFLEGWASRCNGDADRAAEAFEEVARLVPGWQPPPEDHNVLFVLETGFAPLKVKAGIHDEKLVFSRGNDFSEEGAMLSLEPSPNDLRLLTTTWQPGWIRSSVYYQAATRGGRPVDYILKRKAEFKQQAIEGGQEAAEAGAQVAATGAIIAAGAGGGGGGGGSDGMAALGLIIVAVGLVILVGGVVYWAVGELVRPEADTRYWGNLPDMVLLSTARLDPGIHNFRSDFVGQAGGPLPEDLSRRFDLSFDARGNGFGWVRSRSAILEPEFKKYRRPTKPGVN